MLTAAEKVQRLELARLTTTNLMNTLKDLCKDLEVVYRKNLFNPSRKEINEMLRSFRDEIAGYVREIRHTDKEITEARSEYNKFPEMDRKLINEHWKSHIADVRARYGKEPVEA